MARIDIHNLWDGSMRIAINENFKELYKEYTGAGIDAKEAREKAIQAVADSTLAKEDAAVAKEMVQQIIDGAVDTGALNTNIEERLNQKEAEYAPRLNSLDQQLAETVELTVNENSSIRKGYDDGAVFAFSTDDGVETDYTKFKPRFEAEGVPCNSAIVTGQTTDSIRMSVNQLKELKALGWGIVSHTHRHIDPDLVTDEELDNDYRTSKQWLIDNGFDYDIIIYPYGRVYDWTLKIARKYFKMGLNIVRNNLSNDIPHLDNLNINRAPGLSQKALFNGVNREPTLQECKDIVDDAIANNKMIIFEDHSHYPIWTEEKLDELQELIQYIKLKGAPIVNLQDMFNMKCNIVDTDSDTSFYKLHRDGSESRGNYGNRNINNNSPIKDYPYGSTSIFFNNSQISGKGFPTGDAGTLLTNRVSAPANEEQGSYQLFTHYNKPIIYMRKGLANESWGQWEQVAGNGHFVEKARNYYNSENLNTDFPNNQITTFPVDSNAGFLNMNGIVTVYRISGTSAGLGYDRQEFRPYYTDEVWGRHVNASGSWTEWTILYPIQTINKTVDFGEVAPGAIVENEITILGVDARNTNIVVNPDYSIDRRILWFGSVSTNDTVRIKVFNPTNTPIVVNRGFNISLIKSNINR